MCNCEHNERIDAIESRQADLECEVERNMSATKLVLNPLVKRLDNLVEDVRGYFDDIGGRLEATEGQLDSLTNRVAWNFDYSEGRFQNVFSDLDEVNRQLYSLIRVTQEQHARLENLRWQAEIEHSPDAGKWQDSGNSGRILPF